MNSAIASSKNPRNWGAIIRAYFTPKMLGMLSLGFASGLPYMLIYSELSFWMKKENVDLTVIGFFAWIGLAYTFKVFWAPLVDRLKIPFLTAKMGQRRSWMLFAILGTVLGMLVIASSDPSQTSGVLRLAIGAVILATSGATLDISIDAWRIEAAPNDEQTNMADRVLHQRTHKRSAPKSIVTCRRHQRKRGHALFQLCRKTWKMDSYRVLTGCDLFDQRQNDGPYGKADVSSRGLYGNSSRISLEFLWPMARHHRRFHFRRVIHSLWPFKMYAGWINSDGDYECSLCMASDCL